VKGGIFLFLLAGGLVPSSSFAQQRMQPVTTVPSALESHAARIEHDAVEDLKAGQPSTGTFVDLDAVFPTDKAEYEALGKYALLVFALFSDEQEKLPLAHAYSGDVPLRCLKSIARDVLPASATAKAFGKFRADTLCVLPMDLKRKSSRITIDFTKGYMGLEVSSYVLEEPDFVKTDADPRSSPEPDTATLENFIAREYPGFGFQVRP
jgi:hypothetical protein